MYNWLHTILLVPPCLHLPPHHLPQEPKLSASSKMMMGWLKSSTDPKRKESDTGEVKQEGHPIETRPKKQLKPAGPLQQWLQGANKKPRTN